MWEVATSAVAPVASSGSVSSTNEVNNVSSSPSSSSSAGSSSSASPPASTHLPPQYRRKPSRNFPGLVKRSHMGSLASLVHHRPQYNRSASVTASNGHHWPRRPSSLHLPVTQSLSASAASGGMGAASAIISPIFSVATRAINNNLEAVTGGSSLPYPPLVFPTAEFAPGNHLHRPGRGAPANNSSSAKGEYLVLTGI